MTQVNGQALPDAITKALSQFLTTFPAFSTDWVTTLMTDVRTTVSKYLDDVKKTTKTSY